MARRNEEATIKLSADTKDVQAAFDKVAVAYGTLQKAAEDHARAVDLAAKAVTDDEKAIAAEYEKTTRAILKSENARVNSLKKSANAQKGQAEIMRGNTKETKLNTEAIKGAALGLAGLAVVLGKAAQKYMEVDAAAGRLRNANKAAGASAEDVASQQSVAREALVNYGITTLESSNALQKLTDASGDAGKAASDYKLAIDIASQANISLEQATEMLSKARNGEVEELKLLRDINKEQAQDLGKIEDSTVRAELAVKMLTAAYAGSAEANAGAIDKSAAMQAQMDEVTTSVGDVTVAIGEGGVGLVGALAKLIGLAETGDEFFEKFTTGMHNFAGSIREVSQPIYDLVAAGGAIGMLVNGKSIADVLSEADSARARAAASKPAAKKDAPKKEDAKKEVEAELAKQTEKAEKKAADAAAQREKERAASSARSRRDAQERAQEKEAERVAAEATREAEAQAAQLKADAAKIADEAAQREISQREIYNQTLVNEAIARGEDITLLQSQLELEERLVEIRNSDMSAEEQARQNRLALLKQEVIALNEAAKAADAKKKKDDDAAKKKEEETEMLEGNLESLAVTSLKAAEAENVATALQSAKKVGFYGAEAIASFAKGNPISGAAYLAAAAEHAINAGTAVASMGSSGGGGGGAAASPAESAPRSFGPTSMAVAEAREGSITINQSMLSYVSPEDARRIASSEARESRATVGGRRR